MAKVNETKKAVNKRISYNRQLPLDKNALLKEANSLGLLNIKPDLTKPRAKLLACVYQSYKIQRSINHVSFLLVGPTGVGKSATINHLLGTNGLIKFAKTNKSESETRCTQEFVIYGSDPKYEVDLLPLALIDTPGFGDTAGTKQDACNLSSIHKFFSTHEHLKGHYPNLIFLILKASNNRIKGENTELGKSLRCIKELKLVDATNPNVVVILTHACSVRKKTNEEWSEEMKRIKSDVSQIIRDNLKVNAPVVVMENQYSDCKLKIKGDYTKLPNKELQPKNLYEACAEVLDKHGDDLALITLNSIFVNPIRNTSKPPHRGHKIDATIAGDELDDEASRLAGIMESGLGTGPRDPVLDAILEYIKEKKLGPRETEEAMEIGRTLGLVQLDLEQDQSHSVSLHSIEYYFQGGEISSIGRKMLQEKFGITKKPSNTAFVSAGRLVGQGYNILTDKPVPTQVMKFDNTKTKIKYGIVIPNCVEYEKVQHTNYFMEQFESDESYTQSRLTNLNVCLEANAKLFKAGCRAGYNKKDDPTSLVSSTSEYSFLFEQRMFELKIGNYRECLEDGMAFTRDFQSDVENLPTTYDKNDDSCRNRFERFFIRYGHFMVTSAYGGGSVEIKCSKDAIGDRSESFNNAKISLVASFQKLDIANAEFSGSSSSSDNMKANALLNHCSSSWQGGDLALHSNETVIPDKEKFLKWRKSLIANPTMLTSEMTLEPISTAVACVDSKKDDATFEALKDVLRGESDTLVEKAKNEATLPTARKETRGKMDEATTKIDTIKQPKNKKCFPSSSVVSVLSKDGVKKQTKMLNLDVGDKVMAWDEKRNRAIFSEVIMFAHRVSDAIDVEYLKFALEDGNEITLSSNHLVMAGKHKNATMAQNVKRGEILFAVDEHEKISAKKVLAVDKVIEQGVYCPITVHGNLVVDNVLASCYASVKDHVFHKGLVKISAQSIAHFALMPMRALHKLCFKWWRKIPNGQTIHPYLLWLYKLKLPFVAN